MPTQNLVEVLTVADLDAEKRVHDSLVEIWKLKFGHLNYCSDFVHNTWSGKDSKLKFGQDAENWLRIEVDAWSKFWR